MQRNTTHAHNTNVFVVTQENKNIVTKHNTYLHIATKHKTYSEHKCAVCNTRKHKYIQHNTSAQHMRCTQIVITQHFKRFVRVLKSVGMEAAVIYNSLAADISFTFGQKSEL